MKLNELRKYEPQPDGFGIEIEVEGENLPALNTKYWCVHDDGSLRGESFEYVTKGALLLEDVEKALKALNNSFEKKESKLALSFRTSVHVHMNVQYMEVDKLGATIYLYYLFEELLMQYCGGDRIGNRFCLRLQDSEAIIPNIIKAFEEGFRNLDPNRIKYSALNIAPIRTYGSIEFRAMRGTTDVEMLTNWVKILNCLKTSQFETAKDVLEFVEINGFEKLAEVVFGDLFRYLAFENWKQEVVRNSSLTIELPHRLKSYKGVLPAAINNEELLNRAVRELEARLGMPAPAPQREFAPAQLNPQEVNF